MQLVPHSLLFRSVLFDLPFPYTEYFQLGGVNDQMGDLSARRRLDVGVNVLGSLADVGVI